MDSNQVFRFWWVQAALAIACGASCGTERGMARATPDPGLVFMVYATTGPPFEGPVRAWAVGRSGRVGPLRPTADSVVTISDDVARDSNAVVFCADGYYCGAAFFRLLSPSRNNSVYLVRTASAPEIPVDSSLAAGAMEAGSIRLRVFGETGQAPLTGGAAMAWAVRQDGTVDQLRATDKLGEIRLSAGDLHGTTVVIVCAEGYSCGALPVFLGPLEKSLHVRLAGRRV